MEFLVSRREALPVKAKTWIAGLDSLRFVLALIVVLSHLDISRLYHPIASEIFILKLLSAWLANSVVGVAAVISFFILSGIVIHLPYANGRKMNWMEFIIKRYVRIGLPLIAVVLLAKILKLDIGEFPLWSLYCELIYYTLYPLVLLATEKGKLMMLIALAYLVSYLLVFFDSTSFQDLFHQTKNYNGNYWQHGIFLTWLLGLPCWLLGVLIVSTLNIKKKSISTVNIYVTRILIYTASVLCSALRFHFSLSYSLSLNIFALLAAWWIQKEILFWQKRQPLKLLEDGGKWSYSLYICHPFPWLLIAILVQSPGVLSISLQFMLALLFAFVFYQVVERPSHKFAQILRFSRPKTLVR